MGLGIAGDGAGGVGKGDQDGCCRQEHTSADPGIVGVEGELADDGAVAAGQRRSGKGKEPYLGEEHVGHDQLETGEGGYKLEPKDQDRDQVEPIEEELSESK